MSFTRADYCKVFDLGVELWERHPSADRRREMAVALMRMAEGVVGQLHHPDDAFADLMGPPW